jgi:hypothetical protein
MSLAKSFLNSTQPPTTTVIHKGLFVLTEYATMLFVGETLDELQI